MPIKKIILKHNQSTKDLVCKKLNLFVGPNGAGKSKILDEIRYSLSSMPAPYDRKKTENIELDWEFVNQIKLTEKNLKIFGQSFPVNDNGIFDIHHLGEIGQPTSAGASVGNIKNWLNSLDKEDSKKGMTFSLVQPFMIFLTGKKRFQILGNREIEKANGRPNLLTKILYSPEKKKKINKLLNEAFGCYATFNRRAKNAGIEISISQNNQKIPDYILKDELNDKVDHFLQTCTKLELMSDGFQCYFSIICMLVSGDYKIILLDEPEVYLHPPIVHILGKQLTQISNDQQGCRIFVSTHSSDFIEGCLEGSKTESDLTITRLNFSNNKQEVCLVDLEHLKARISKPILRSANLLKGLFYDCIALVDGEADVLVYNQVYSSLLKKRSLQTQKNPRILFVSCYSKDNMPAMIDCLNSFGTRVVAINDFDILQSGFDKLIRSFKLTNEQDLIKKHNKLSEKFFKFFKNKTPNEEDKKIRETLKSSLKKDGINNFVNDQSLYNETQNLLNSLSKEGMFVVPIGELEGWYNLPGKKDNYEWLNQLFSTSRKSKKSEKYWNNNGIEDFVKAIICKEEI